MPCILAVDIGTTSAKALVITDQGEVLADAREYYPTHRRQPDYAEQDADEIFQAVRKIIQITSEKVHGKVDGVSFSSAMHSFMAVNDQGEALTPLIIWADLRAKEQAIQIKSDNGQKVYEETGTPVHPMSPLCKILWLKKNQPEIFSKAFKFIGIKEYIWFRIFGEYAIDYSIASATGLFNASTKSWSAVALRIAGISDHHLSTPCSVYKSFHIREERITNQFALQKEVPWIIGASDGCLANLGSGAMDTDTLSITIGTSGAVRKVVQKISPDHKGRTFHYLLDEDTVITGGATNNGAILIDWYSENILKEKVNIKSFGERAASVPAGAEGLIFLPYLLGERAPVFDPESSGVFMGVRLLHRTEHFMRAIVEGIGYALFSIAEIVEENSGGYQRVMASGGFVGSTHWTQMMADIFGKEVHVHANEDASALGAAIQGLKALHTESHFLFPSEKTYIPDPVAHSVYQKYYSVYKSLYPHLSADFHQLNKITKA